MFQRRRMAAIPEALVTQKNRIASGYIVAIGTKKKKIESAKNKQG